MSADRIPSPGEYEPGGRWEGDRYITGPEKPSESPRKPSRGRLKALAGALVVLAAAIGATFGVTTLAGDDEPAGIGTLSPSPTTSPSSATNSEDFVVLTQEELDTRAQQLVDDVGGSFSEYTSRSFEMRQEFREVFGCEILTAMDSDGMKEIRQFYRDNPPPLPEVDFVSFVKNDLGYAMVAVVDCPEE